MGQTAAVAELGAIRLLTEEQVAEMFQVSKSRLQAWRSQGTGPEYVKMGPGKKSLVRYDSKKVVAFIDAHRKKCEYDRI